MYNSLSVHCLFPLFSSPSISLRYAGSCLDGTVLRCFEATWGRIPKAIEAIISRWLDQSSAFALMIEAAILGPIYVTISGENEQLYFLLGRDMESGFENDTSVVKTQSQEFFLQFVAWPVPRQETDLWRLSL